MFSRLIYVIALLAAALTQGVLAEHAAASGLHVDSLLLPRANAADAKKAADAKTAAAAKAAADAKTAAAAKAAADAKTAAASKAAAGQQNAQANTGVTCLKTNAIQKSSDKTGQETGTDGIKAGQAKSATDPANFINFCSGKTVTDGKQIKTGSCNGIPMGKIPATTNMVSAIITNPQPGDKVTAGKTFNISVQTVHLAAGNFVNPTTQYYTAPQDLNAAGDIIGHGHVTVQDIGNLKQTTPPDANKFAFFKGIDDAGNGKGLLQAVVDGGLPAGVYRVCTIMSAQNHQPVAMPIAQRGAQDDCTKFEVVGAAAAGGNNNAAAAKAGAAKAATGKAAAGAAKAGAAKGKAKAKKSRR